MSAKQLVKAEKFIGELERIDSEAFVRPHSPGAKVSVKALLSAADKYVGGLPEGDLKTDLATAAYMYQKAVEQPRLNVDGEAPEPCFVPRLGAPSGSCDDRQGPSRNAWRDQARQRTRWARALIARQKGYGGQDVMRVLEEAAAAHEVDRALARRAVAALKVLEGEVIVYKTHGDFEEGGTLARVPFKVFAADVRQVSAHVGGILTLLPRNRLRAAIDNALRSYIDGCFWWAKLYRPKVVDVADLPYQETSQSPSDVAYSTTLPYTIAGNWRHASRYLRRAEEILGDEAVDASATERPTAAVSALDKD